MRKFLYVSLILLLCFNVSCSKDNNTIANEELHKEQKELLKQININNTFAFKYNTKKTQDYKFYLEIYEKGEKQKDSFKTLQQLENNKIFYAQLTDDIVSVCGVSGNIKTKIQGDNVNTIKVNKSLNINEDSILIIYAKNKSSSIHIPENIFNDKQLLKEVIKENDIVYLLKGKLE